MAESKNQHAGFGSRFLAYVIDTLIILAVNMVLGMVGGSLGDAAVGVVNVLSMVLSIAYFIYFWTRDGQTPGKKVLGLRIEKVNGEKLDVVAAILRYVGYILSSLPLGLGFFWIIWDKEKQGWHDKIAGTVVVKTK